jgi:uncharacterized protein (TIGR03437 family)
MVVESAGVRSVPQVVQIRPTSPGLFDTGVTTVRAGEVVTLWATGEGVLTPPQPDGGLIGLPLPSPQATVSLRINGVPATVLYAGGSPGSVAGLLQINARVPNGVDGPARFELEIR